MYNPVTYQIILVNNHSIILNINSKKGKLLHHLRTQEWIFYNKKYKQIKLLKKNNNNIKLDKNILYKIFYIKSISKIPNLNKWNYLRNVIRKHL
jgi:hypothetical protein